MRVWCKSLARPTTTLAQLLAIGALSAACGEGSDEPGSPTGMTMAQFCQKSAEVSCAHLAGCCSLTVTACVDAHRSGCDESRRNATSRGLSFDAEAAQRCTDASQGLFAGCVVPSSEGSSAAGLCALVFTPSLPPGASCTFDAACQGGDASIGVCSSGVCEQVPLLGDGAACGGAVAGKCASGAYCDGTCTPLKSMGQSCAAAVECASGACEAQSCGTRPIDDLCAALTDSK